MDEQELQRLFSDSSPEEIREYLTANLDVPSPLVGSKGPTDPGPEEPYLRALESCQAEALAKAGDAVNQVLLAEAAEGSAKKAIARPMLVFNLLTLLRGVGLPGVEPGLAALRRMEDVLRSSLTDRDEDLYRHALLAVAENQRGSELKDFWLALLNEGTGPYAEVAAIGLRNAGWYVGCQTLADVKEAYAKNPALGDFSLAVMLMVDEHPEANWPQCARIFYDEFHHPDILRLIEQHSGGRYEEPLSEMPAECGTALDDLRRRLDPQELDRLDRQLKEPPVSPAEVLRVAAA